MLFSVVSVWARGWRCYKSVGVEVNQECGKTNDDVIASSSSTISSSSSSCCCCSPENNVSVTEIACRTADEKRKPRHSFYAIWNVIVGN